jgi:hypothetical protein
MYAIQTLLLLAVVVLQLNFDKRVSLKRKKAYKREVFCAF